MISFFSTAANAIVPFFFYMMIGYHARLHHIVNDEFFENLNSFVFSIMFRFMTFYHIYNAGHNYVLSKKLLIFTGISISAVAVLLTLFVPYFVHKNSHRSVIIQASYRSNVALLGMPLTIALFGEQKAAPVAILITLAVIFYNISSVLVFSRFSATRSGVSFRGLVSQLFHNPLLQGCFVGFLFYSLELYIPDYIINPIATIANMTSPLAMIALGGKLRFQSLNKNIKYLVPVLTLKLLLLPLVVVIIAWVIGLREIELFLTMLVFATPVAASSYPMAESMGGDGELAGQFVFISAALSVVTLFVWIVCFRLFGLI